MSDGSPKAPSAPWRDRVISSLKWSAIGRLSAQSMNWATTLVVIRLLSPADYGLMASAMVVVGLALVVRDLGVVSSVIRSRELTEDELRSCKSSIFLISISMSVMLFLMSFVIVRLIGEAELQPILQVFAISFLLLPVGTLEFALLRKEMRFKKIAVSELCAALLASVALLVFAFSGAGVWSLVAGSIVNQVAISIGYKLSYGRRIGFSLNLHPALRHMRFGIPVSLQQILMVMNGSIINFVIGQVHGVVALGLLSVARDLSRIPVNKAMPVVNSVMLPAFSAVQDDLEKIRNGYLVGAGALSTVFVATLWGFAGTADAMVPLVMGRQWLEAIPVIQIFSIWVPLTALMYTFPSIAVATGHSNQAFSQSVVYVVLSIVALVLSVSTGIEGCAVALGVAAFLASLSVAWRISSILHCSILWFFKPMTVPVIAGAAMLAVLWPLKEYGIAPHDGVANLLTRIAAGALVYCGVFLLIAKDQLIAYRKILFKR